MMRASKQSWICEKCFDQHKAWAAYEKIYFHSQLANVTCDLPFIFKLLFDHQVQVYLVYGLSDFWFADRVSHYNDNKRGF
jgi:hypothetical protein